MIKLSTGIGQLQLTALKELFFTAVDLGFPNYGYYGGLRYGLRQFDPDRVAPANRLDRVNLQHDIRFQHSEWVRAAWAGPPPGPFGFVYTVLGTPFFAAAGALQQ